MEKKILTVSIAAYNVEEYIKDTLESLIVPQILEDLEVIIVNDGSVDSTSIIAEKYVKKHPDVFRLINKNNGGYGSTINTSIKIANGKYFKQLDGDDWFDKENLADFIEFLKASDADCVYSPYWKIYQDSGKRDLIKSENLKKNEIAINDTAMHSLTYKTKVFIDNKIEISEHCFYTDNEYSLKPLFFINTIDYYTNPIYCYRLDRLEQSVSKEGWKKHYKDSNNVSLELMSYYKQNKEIMVCKNKNILKKRITSLYKENFIIALELADSEVQKQYKELDLTVKRNYPQFYAERNVKMKLLAYSNYKFWGMIRLFHKLFEDIVISK